MSAAEMWPTRRKPELTDEQHKAKRAQRVPREEIPNECNPCPLLRRRRELRQSGAKAAAGDEAEKAGSVKKQVDLVYAPEAEEGTGE